MHPRMRKNRMNGFSLIEVMVVLGLMSVALSLHLYPKGFVGAGAGTVLAFLHVQVNKKDSASLKAYGNKTLDASDIPININVTHSSDQNQISGCGSATVGSATTLLARHSFSSTAPSCPTG